MIALTLQPEVTEWAMEGAMGFILLLYFGQIYNNTFDTMSLIKLALSANFANRAVLRDWAHTKSEYALLKSPYFNTNKHKHQQLSSTIIYFFKYFEKI